MLHHVENHIEKMRQKPDHIKQQYAFGVSLVITLIILGFWLSAQTLSLNPEAAALAKKQTSPIQALTANASDAYDYIKGMIFGGNKTEYKSDAIEVVPGRI